MDPHGFALENFDVIGGWRDHYRSIGEGTPITKEGRSMRYRQGPAVEAADELADGREFGLIQKYKQLLIADRERIAEALAGKLLSYATGANVEWADREDIKAIVKTAREKNYGFRTMIHAVTRSSAFRQK
jgi:hypothetical protein